MPLVAVVFAVMMDRSEGGFWDGFAWVDGVDP